MITLIVLIKYPAIKKMFLHFNATLPSSVPVERLFSFAGIITRPHRHRLGDRMFEILLLLKENKSFMFGLLMVAIMHFAFALPKCFVQEFLKYPTFILLLIVPMLQF